LANRLELRISKPFHGTIWNLLADGGSERLFVEVRDPGTKTVSFSALNLRNNQWLWKDVVFDERWWISMRAVAGDILLLTLYADENNPDKKALIAYDVESQQVVWWQNGFSVTNVSNRAVKGIDARFPEKESILDIVSGKPMSEVDFHLEDLQNFPVIRPFQYREGTGYFDTVRDFLSSRWGISPVAMIEYLEFESLIIASVFLREKGLANYLYVLSTDGELLKKELLGENLQGIAVDTFCIYARQLIFVRNKNELISFNIL
jgi:hypothetical protein